MRNLCSVCCFLSLFVGVSLRAAENSYVRVTSDNVRVLCVGADFLVIPRDPFSSSPISVSVNPNIGWILRSRSVLSISPGGVASWAVKGDNDNPEDEATGQIYVASVRLEQENIELLRSDEDSVPFEDY